MTGSIVTRMEHLELRGASDRMLFSPHSSAGQYILDHEGFGLPDVNLRIFTSEGRDGAVLGGYRVLPRQLLIRLGIRAASRNSLGLLRERLQNIISVGGETAVDIHRPDGTVRTINGIRQGGDDLTFRTTNRFGLMESAAVRLLCLSPYFQSAQEVRADISGINGQRHHHSHHHPHACGIAPLGHHSPRGERGFRQRLSHGDLAGAAPVGPRAQHYHGRGVRVQELV